MIKWTAVQQFSVDKQCLEIAEKETLLEIDRLLHKIMSQEVMLNVMNSTFLNNDIVNMKMQKCDSCEKCLNLDAELTKSKQAYNALLKNHSQLEKHCISLEVSMQSKQEVFQNDNSCVNHNAVEIQEYFEINDLKAQLQDKDKTICKLKDTIRSLSKNAKEENVNHDKCDLEPINEELENSVATLLLENERLCNEINHVKQVFKEQFDSIKQTRFRHKEHSDSLISKLNLKTVENEDLKAQIQDKVFVITSLKNDLRKLKGKEIVENASQIPSATTIAPSMFKLDLVPLPPSELDFACKYATRIQELLVYVQDTCPNAITHSSKKIAVTPMNNVKKVRFAEPITSSSKTQQVESSKTSDSNTPVLSSTGVKCSTSNCGSKPPGNKKNDRISQPPSRNKKNKHSLSNANSDIICATCNKSMFDGVHDKCLLDLVQNGNKRSKSAKKHKKQNIWKPTGHVFTEVGFKWKPTGRIFTIVGNSCPLTRFTSTNIVPPKQTTPHSVEIQKPEIKVYSRKPKNVRNIGSSKIAKTVESKKANHFMVQFCGRTKQFPQFSLMVSNLLFIKWEISYPCLSGTVRFENDQIVRINVMVTNQLTKDEVPEAIITCIKNIQVRLNATVRNVQTYNETEFINQTLREFYENVDILHQTSVSRTPQQNGIVERQNQTLVEVSRAMLIFSKASLFLWAEAINTACYTQNRSLIRLRYNKTPYELMQDKKPNLSLFHVFGALCYPTNDNDDLGKLDVKVKISIFVGYTPAKKAFRIYNKRTHKIIETIHVTFNELTTMASEQFSLGPGLHSMTPATSSSGLVPNTVFNNLVFHQTKMTGITGFNLCFEESPKIPIFHDDPLHESLHDDSTSQGLSSNVRKIHTSFEHLGKWTKDHPIANVIGDPSHFVSIRKQLQTDAMWCYFDAFLTSVEPKNFKQAMIEPSWIVAMQEEIHEFERLQVWELVPYPDKVLLIKLKWIYKVKTDEFGGVLKNKARLVAQGFRQEEGIDFEELFASVA
ncbi:retrovirus-related pol polyprotein from transposon TNT 1-94 [Tanacetum coccineum]